MATWVENFNGNIIRWAIERAGFDLQTYIAGNPKIEKWLQGQKAPTLKQLESFSKKVHVPLGYLFLEEPPQESLDFPFFRTGKNPSRNVSLNTYEMVQTLQERQEWLSGYMKDNDYTPLSFVGRFADNQAYTEIVDDIRNTLGLAPDWASVHRTWEDALRDLSIRIEEAGIITTFSGYVGYNNNRPIDVDECRGFVLVDEYCPFLFVNTNDAKSAQMFTILHELAHIWIGQSAGFSNDHLLPADDGLEKLCDLVAAEFLVPERLLEEQMAGSSPSIPMLSRRFKVSPIVIGRRMLDLGYMEKEEFFDFYYTRMRWAKKQIDDQEGRGNFYTTALRRSSPRFTSFVNIATRENALSYRDAYHLMGLKGSTYHTLIKEHLY